MIKSMPFLFLSCFAFSKNTADFKGDFISNHSLYMASENRTIHNIQDRVRIQPVSEKKANILIETYTQNFHSCQLIGEANMVGDSLVFKSSINKKLNRGKVTTCLLKITQIEGSVKAIRVEDKQDSCRLRYCGLSAELSGDFKEKTVQFKDKN
jgi:hypothetical protein